MDPLIPLRVLLVEDQASDAELIVMRLAAEGFAPEVHRVETESEYVAALQNPPDIVLSDWVLPSFSGLRALELHQSLAVPCPFVIVSGSIGEEVAIDLMRRGATDYVLKDRPVRLGAVVRRALADVRMRAQQHRAAETIALQVAALEAAANAIVVTDREGTIEWVNAAFTTLTGHTVAESIGRNPRDLVRSGEQSAAFYQSFWETILSGAAWRGEMINRRKDGTLYVEEQTVTSVRDREGRIAHFIAIKQDVTARKLAEAEREELQSELVQSQKMESIGMLAGGIAHDFNNMLAAIIGYSELTLHKLGAGHSVQPHVEAIRTAAQRSANLTRQLLAFARKQVIAPKVIDLNETIAGMLKMLRHLLGETVTITWQPSKALWPVSADPTQIDQILANLAVNAKDAMANREAVLAVSTANVTLDEQGVASRAQMRCGEFVRLRVQDSGIGMTAETMARIFEPFFTTKAPGQGTGLGLSTVFGIMQQHHGFLDVASTPNQGSTFDLYFPRGSALIEASSGPAETLPRGTETILLVEDEHEVLLATGSMLEMLGYSVLAARSGAEAVSLAAAHTGPLQLLLSDVVMPGMNGVQLRKTMLEIRPTLKVMLMSGYPNTELGRAGGLDPAIHFLQKPFTATVLAQRVREVLDA